MEIRSYLKVFVIIGLALFISSFVIVKDYVFAQQQAPNCCWDGSSDFNGRWDSNNCCRTSVLPPECCTTEGNCALIPCPTCNPAPDPEPDPEPDPQPDPCVRCTLGNCPNPPLSNNESPYVLPDFVSCSDSGDCTPPTTHYRSCYEIPNAQPTTSLAILHETNPTSYGFVSETHTGAGRNVGGIDDSVNEPIRMVATYTDSSSNDIEAIYVWFKQGSANPVTPRFIDLDNSSSGQARKTPSNSQFGFMMHRTFGFNSYWSPYVPGIEGSGNSAGDRWLPVSYVNNRIPITGPNGHVLATVLVNGISYTGVSVILDFSVYFHQQYPVIDGNYNVFLMGNDIFGFTPYDNYTDYPEVDARIKDLWGPEEIRLTTHWANKGNWNVDLTSPVINNLTIAPVGPTSPTTLRISWTLNDNLAIYGVVGNLYLGDNYTDPKPFTLTRVTGGGTVLPTIPSTFNATVQGDNKVGYLQNNYLFRSLGNFTSGTADLNVNDNRGGNIIFHLTGFDRGGNPVSTYSIFDLRDWMVTKGGLLYSESGVDVTIRSISNGAWSGITLLREFSPNAESNVDITSELLGDKLGTLPPPAPVKATAVKSYAIRRYETTDVAYYSILRSNFDRRVQFLDAQEIAPPAGALIGNMTNNTRIRYMYTTNLTVGTPTTDFNCNGKGVFFVSGNLTINGNVLNSNANRDACIFVVQGNVLIRGGRNMSNNNLRYDPLNAYILTEGEVLIEPENSTILDGLFVNGGIHSLDGITVQRYLGLLYRLQYPVFTVKHHSKYGVFAGQLFGSEVSIQKVEVGLKPY